MAQTTETAAAPVDAPTYDREWLAKHLAEERHESDLLSEIRELIFGAQDGLVSTLAVVSTVGGASLTIASESASRFPILVAGIASGLAGIFSMAAGEYIGSKSQREIFDAQIVGEREEVRERPEEARAEMAYMLEEDGLPPEEATRVAGILARHPEVLLRTMAEKRNAIQYEFRELPRGGEVRIRSADPEAVEAIHTFLAFQRGDHRAAGHAQH